MALALAGCAHRPADPEAHQRRAERRARIGAAIKAAADSYQPSRRFDCTGRVRGDTIDAECSER